MYYDNHRNNRLDTNSVVFYLIAANVVLFLVTNFAMPGLQSTLALHYPASDQFNAIQILTHMFMHAPLAHGGIMHIFFNMFNLYMFGTVLERVWGPKRFIEFYILTGFGAMVLHTFVQGIEVYQLTGTFFPNSLQIIENYKVQQIMQVETVGASGAVFGLLTAFGLLFSNTELYLYGAIPVKAKYLIGGLIAWELYRGFVFNPDDNVAHFAHLGGALIGFIIVKIWNRNRNSLY